MNYWSKYCIKNQKNSTSTEIKEAVASATLGAQKMIVVVKEQRISRVILT